MGELFDTILIDPVINFLMMLSNLFGDSFGIAIVIVTLVVNVLLLPMTIKQTRSMKKMQSLQPKMQELQKKYSKDKQKLQQETMKLYKEEGMNPVGCIMPMLLQMPIWIALYQSIMQSLPTTPERLIGLSKHIYDYPLVQEGVPPESIFLGLDLSQPNFIMVLLIMVSMWITQKMSTNPSADPKQQQMQQMMQWMMPLFLGFIFLSFPSGLALYIVVMNIFRMAVQYFITGNWGGLEPLMRRLPFATAPASQGSEIVEGKDTKGWTPSDDKTAKEIESAAQKSNAALKKGKGTRYGRARSQRKKRR